jgi:3-hydroxybutyryl-CoA dehydrogenase
MTAETVTVLVVGTGTMGAGIGQVAAMAGDHVFLHDAVPGAAIRAKERIAESLARAAERGRLDAATIPAVLGRLCPVESFAAARDVSIVIEAVKEDVDVKRAVFARLDAAFTSSTLLWTNTSMIPITTIAEGLRHPERVAGTHFFNPAPRMPLVELIAGQQTSAETMSRVEETVTRWGKTPVRAPETPGFIVNRILDAIKRESLALLDEGVAAADIDLGVRLGLNFPMGPFELMDLIGLNTTLDCMIAQARGMGRPAKFSPKIEELVEQGHWGRKTGRGFYTYPSSP